MIRKLCEGVEHEGYCPNRVNWDNPVNRSRKLKPLTTQSSHLLVPSLPTDTSSSDFLQVPLPLDFDLGNLRVGLRLGALQEGVCTNTIFASLSVASSSLAFS